MAIIKASFYLSIGQKVPWKENQSLLTILMMKIQIKDIQERSFASTTIRADIKQINVPLSSHWLSKQNKKRANTLMRREGLPSMR